MLFKLSIQNMKHSMKNYVIYFFTLVLGIAIFYVFNAMDAQQAMMEISSSKYELMELLNTVLSMISVFISIILGLLIIYASRFLMKRRKKEFGIYLTLGMSKSKISKILVLETFLIGLLSLIVGLGLGIVLSQLVSLLVIQLFSIDMSQYRFVFSSMACIKTLIYFSIMYFIVLIFNVFSVSKCRLIELIQASKINEKLKVKNKWLCVICFLISVIILGSCYYLVSTKAMSLDEGKAFVICALGAFSTYLFFWSLSGFLLRLVQSVKRVYLKNLNMFVLRQLNSNVNTMVFSMTVICLLLFLTITIFSSATSLNHALRVDLEKYAPSDFLLRKESIEGNTTSITSSFGTDLFNNNLKDWQEVKFYEISTVTYKEIVGPYLEELKKQFSFVPFSARFPIMELSEYNKVAKLYHTKTYELNESEYLVLANFNQMEKILNKALKDKPTLTINENQYQLKYDSCQEGFIDMSFGENNTGILIVPDGTMKDVIPKYYYLIGNYQTGVEESVFLKEFPEVTWLDASTKISIRDGSTGLGAIVTFVGLYLGIIFLITSAAILSLKELSESTDNKERYAILRKIGVNEKSLHFALGLQIGIFFLLPLFLACIHSIFGIQFISQILSAFANKQLLSSILLTAFLLIIIYGGYYLITYFCSKSIISERE